ncbi:bidirectional sugar transporter SWEET2b [Cryptomeria japonica]|uniref:bidirectional sugar transporter SWEET2b n=1 Tax=Cryptomeria japonica TaxID=3369 RepID=UPI0027DA7DB6|nr:bidirectional sugar transporter SWEET2b [Cryptomeria japonica]
MASEETWHFAAGIAGNVFALALFLSPIHTFVRIRRNKSTEQYSGLPYIFAFMNCLICTWYGLPIVSRDNILVATVNGTGAFFQLFYICIYIAFSQKEARVKMVALLSLVIGIFTAIAMVSYEFMRQPLRRMFIGCLSIASLISMFAAPLSIIKLVIQTHSVEYMPFYLSLSTFLMSTSFFAYGLLGHDPFVSAPNGIGSFLGIIQLVLYLHYRRLSWRSCDTQPLLSSRITLHDPSERLPDVILDSRCTCYF